MFYCRLLLYRSGVQICYFNYSPLSRLISPHCYFILFHSSCLCGFMDCLFIYFLPFSFLCTIFVSSRDGRDEDLMCHRATWMIFCSNFVIITYILNENFQAPRKDRKYKKQNNICIHTCFKKASHFSPLCFWFIFVSVSIPALSCSITRVLTPSSPIFKEPKYFRDEWVKLLLTFCNFFLSLRSSEVATSFDVSYSHPCGYLNIHICSPK